MHYESESRLDTKEAAKVLNLSVSTLCKKRLLGGGPSFEKLSKSERLCDELWRLREKISGTRARTNEGVGAKLSAAVIAFKLDDEDSPLFKGHGSLDGILRSIHHDMLALDAENTAALAARRSALLEPVDA